MFEALVMEKIVTSALLSLFLFVSAMDCYGQWPLGKEGSQPQAKTVESGVSVSGSGRFQIFVSPNVKGHTFMIDTDTGKIWMFRKDNTSGDFSLQRVPVEQEAVQGGHKDKK